MLVYCGNKDKNSLHEADSTGQQKPFTYLQFMLCLCVYVCIQKKYVCVLTGKHLPQYVSSGVFMPAFLP